jgi:hypothetical protein
MIMKGSVLFFSVPRFNALLAGNDRQLPTPPSLTAINLPNAASRASLNAAAEATPAPIPVNMPTSMHLPCGKLAQVSGRICDSAKFETGGRTAVINKGLNKEPGIL